MNATVTIETIDPKQALQLLENKFEGQRRERPSWVQSLAKEIREKKFRLSSDALLICKGKLGNGQHRLRAVVESGMSAEFIVMRSDDESVYQVIDAGIKRTVADVLSVRDGYASDVVSCARLSLEYDERAVEPMSKNQAKVVTRSDVVAYAELYIDELREAAIFTKGHYAKKPIVTVRIMGTLLHLVTRQGKNKDKARAFVQSVYDGLSRDDAAHDLREKFIRNSSGASKLPSNYLFGIAIKAYKAYLIGQRCQILRIVPDEKFPTL